jgi:hypothetical protein
LSIAAKQAMVRVLGEQPEIKHTELAVILGVSEKTVRRWRKDADIAAATAGVFYFHQPNLDVPLDVGAVRFMLAGDQHVPLTSFEMVHKMVELSLENDVTDLIINGDLSNADAQSIYEPKQRDHTARQEVSILRKYFWELLNVYKNIHLIEGNHDHRWVRAWGHKVDFIGAMYVLLGDDLWDTGRINVSNLDHMFAGPEDNKWYICHPKAYSRQPLVGTRRMAYKVGMNVASGHSHHFAIGMADNGKHVCVESGGTFDRDKAAYLQASTGYPVQTPGLCWVDETGRAHPWSPSWG